MRYLLADVNVWLATVVGEHPHHSTVMAWWRDQILERDDRVAFCRITQLGFLRLVTNERVMGRQRKSIAEAWSVYERMAAARPVVFAPEPEGLDSILERLCRRGGSSRKFWTDGYLAAFALAGDLELATFDRGFGRFPRLKSTILG